MIIVEDQVRSIIAEQLGIKADEIKDDASFVDDLGADSLDTVELVMALEEEFDISVEEEELSDVATVGDAIALVESKL